MSRNLIGSAIVGMFLVGLVSVTGTLALAPQEETQNEVIAIGGPEPQILFTFAGGILELFVARVQDAPTTIPESPGFFLLPGTPTTLSVPAGDTDIFVATFSGECRLFNASTEDFVQVEVRRNGIPLEPQSPANQMAFCSDNNYNMSSATFVSPRVGPGPHTFQVFWKLFDAAPAGVLTGWLDDWTFKIDQHN